MALSRRVESAASNGLDRLGTALQAAEAEMDAALCRSGTLAARDTELAALQCSLSLRERELADARMALAEAKRCAAQRDAQVTSQLTDVRGGRAGREPPPDAREAAIHCEAHRLDAK